MKEQTDFGTRRSGRTTRLIDEAIQYLFTNDTVLLVDHINSTEMSKHMLDRVVRRLYNEHRMTDKQFKITNEGGYKRITLVK
jgi:hypothetical protein